MKISDCIVCEDDAGEGYNLCRNCRNKRNVVTIGDKGSSFYISKIMELGQYHDEIIMKTLRNKMDVANIIVMKMFVWGLEETGKRTIRKEKRSEKEKEMEVYYIRLEMIPALRGLKVDARRKNLPI